MGHFAEIDDNNVVLRVIVCDDDDSIENQRLWIINNIGGVWVQTDPNSYAGKTWSEDKSTIINNFHLRYNFASEGYLYNEEYDAFHEPDPSSETEVFFLDKDTFTWVQI
jgi:hypothetical protein